MQENKKIELLLAAVERIRVLNPYPDLSAHKYVWACQEIDRVIRDVLFELKEEE